MEYSLTDEDVRRFLGSKRDDECVGYCGCSSSCLLAQVVGEKYPGVRVNVYDGSVLVWNVRADLSVETANLGLTPKMRRIVDVFDSVAGCGYEDVVTKGMFLQAWQFSQQGEI